jgi:hypothetical protein
MTYLRSADTGRGIGVWVLRLVLLALVLVAVMGADAMARERKPKVPPGIDPGGVVVAIASPWGLDYTHPEMTPRLARDGEGELLGWDFVDNDRQPFERTSSGVPKGFGVALGRLLIAEGKGVRLMPLTIKAETAVLGHMVAVAGQSPARILLVETSPTARREDWLAFAQAAQQFKDVLIILPAEPLGAGVVSYPAALGLGNVLSVVGAGAGGQVPTKDVSADVAVTTRALPVPTGRSGDMMIWGMMWGPGVAAARVAALAARLLAANPKVTGAALKARILELATPLSSPAPVGPRLWIAAPDRVGG